jgi:hypothetical protein
MAYNQSCFSSSTTENSSSCVLNSESYLKSEGILSSNEQYETIYLAEDEIEKFMEKYLSENPDTDIATRYLHQPPVELVQDIEVRWLRPETPEIPPIIIREVDVCDKPEPPIRIIQKRAEPARETPREPLIIRERPPLIPMPEPKFAYVQNVRKKECKPAADNVKEIKVEHVKSESQTSFSHRGEFGNRLVSENRTHNCSFEEHQSIVDYEEEYEHRHDDPGASGVFRPRGIQKKSADDEHQLRLYEEKLKQTLYEEYLLRLEREQIERKLAEQGVLEERIRERSASQDRAFAATASNARLSELREAQREEEFREQQRLREQVQVRESRCRQPVLPPKPKLVGAGAAEVLRAPDTSTYKNVKFEKVTDPDELRRLNEILSNPNAPCIKTKAEGDRILTPFEPPKAANPQPPPPQPKKIGYQYTSVICFGFFVVVFFLFVLMFFFFLFYIRQVGLKPSVRFRIVHIIRRALIL